MKCPEFIVPLACHSPFTGRFKNICGDGIQSVCFYRMAIAGFVLAAGALTQLLHFLHP
jgi:hypothetical protein